MVSCGYEEAERYENPFCGGSKAGVKIEPIGFLVVKDGGVRMINVEPQAKNGVDRVIDMVPDVMDRIENIANNAKKTRLKRFNL